MKKTLALFTLSLLLVAAMILGASAKVENSNVGAYVRFDSQAAIDTYILQVSNAEMTFDAEKGALHFMTFGGVDNCVYVKFPDGVDIIKYPYLRITYMIDAGGATTANSFIVANDDAMGVEKNLPTGTDKWLRYTLDARKMLSTNDLQTPAVDANATELVIYDTRLDIPNDNTAAEVWIYDIGYFETVEALYAYSYNQTNLVVDMTDPDVIDDFAATQGEFVYDEELGAGKFVHAAHNPANGDTDGRASYAPDATGFFSLANLPFLSVMHMAGNNDYTYDEAMELSEDERLAAAATAIASETYIINRVAANDYSGSGQWNWAGGPYEIVNTKAFEWEKASANLASILEDNGGATQGTALVIHEFDPVNTLASMTTLGNEYRAYKYIAYYATQEEANLEAQAAPKGLAGVAPASGEGLGKITGLNAELSYEYRQSGNGNIYIAVPAGSTEITELPAGKTYDVRLAAVEGVKNAGYAAEVAVPMYWNFTINSVEGVDSAVIDSTDPANWSVVLPATADLTAVTLNTSAAYGTKTARVIAYGDSRRAAIGALDVSENVANQTPVKLAVYVAKGIYKAVNVTFELEQIEGGDQGIVDSVVDLLEEKDIDNSVLVGLSTEGAVKDAVAAAADIAGIAQSYGVSVEVVVDTLTPPTAGDADDIDGEDGIIKYHFVVAKNEASAATAPAIVELPAKHFRVLWKFNDPDLVDMVTIRGGKGWIVDDNGNLPIVKDGDKHYMRIQAGENGVEKPSSTSAGYFTMTAATEAEVKQGTYNSFLNLDDYPYVVVSYRSSQNLPSWLTIYWTTSFMVQNNTYDESTNTGVYYGYEWLRNSGIWETFNSPLFPANTEGTKVVIDTIKGTDGIELSGQGCLIKPDGTPDYGKRVKFPWKGDLTEWRYDFAAVGDVAAGEYYDLEYIAFFSDKQAAEAFAGEVAKPMSAQDKAAVDGLSLDDIAGETTENEEAVMVTVKAAVEAALAENEFDRVEINTVEYKNYNLNDGSDGIYTFTVTVLKGGVVGDRDFYTSEPMNITITCPDISVADAVAELEALTYTSALLYSEQDAKAAVENTIAQIKTKYTGIEFTVNTVNFTAPVGTTAGKYEFTVTVGTLHTQTLNMSIKGLAEPVIFDFSNPIVRANFGFGVDRAGSTIELVEDANALGGYYTRYTRVGAANNFNIYATMGVNGMPVIEELSEYPVVLYRYRAPGHASGQIYYYTLVDNGEGYVDAYTDGHMYQDVVPDTEKVGEWNNHFFTVDPDGEKAMGTETGDTRWANKLNSIRFDFFRNTSAAGVALELDYIGLFASMEQAEEFAAAPALEEGKSVTELEAEYAEAISAINAVEDGSLTIVDGLYSSNTEAIRAFVDSLDIEGEFDYYVAVKSYTAPTHGLDGTDGSLKFTIVFAENTTNGNYVETKELTMRVLANKREIDFISKEETQRFIRIATTMNKTWMEEIKGTGTITYGTLITSKAALGDKALDHALLEELNVGGAKVVADVLGTKIYYIDHENDTWTYTARITNVPENQENTELVCCSYVKYNFNGVEIVDYFDTTTFSFASVTDAE